MIIWKMIVHHIWGLMKKQIRLKTKLIVPVTTVLLLSGITIVNPFTTSADGDSISGSKVFSPSSGTENIIVSPSNDYIIYEGTGIKFTDYKIDQIHEHYVDGR